MIHEDADVFADLENRVHFEVFIADCAARFAAVQLPSDLERQIELALRELAKFFHADRCALLGGAPGEGLSWITCAASADSIGPPFGEMNFADAFPWHFKTLCGGERPLSVETFADLPLGAETDRQSAEAMGIRSMLTVPVHSYEGGAHCLVIQALRHECPWPASYVARLSVLTAVFANALSQKRIEETRRVETSHHDLLESVGAILWRADARTFQTTFVSKEAEAILGYPVESWVKVPGFWRDHIHPDDRAWVEALSSSAIRERRRHDFEYRMTVADGRTVWLRNIVNVLAEDDQPTTLVGVTVDITARKHAEFEAAQLRHQVTHAGRVSSLGELAATLAHELNQPLGAMVSNAEAAAVFVARVPPDLVRIRATLDDIVRDGQRAGGVVHRIRRLLQKQVLEMQPLDVHRLVDEVVGLARALALSRAIELSVDVEPGLPSPHGDAVQLQQVLINLLLNAMDAVIDQPVHARHVTVSAAARDASTVELSVIDTGSGIPVEALPQIFDPFFTTKTSGMGMGLAICRTIVEAHGGDIRVENGPRGGAIVRFTLPISARRENGAS